LKSDPLMHGCLLKTQDIKIMDSHVAYFIHVSRSHAVFPDSYEVILYAHYAYSK
jgi:hypothetical protein